MSEGEGSGTAVILKIKKGFGIGFQFLIIVDDMGSALGSHFAGFAGTLVVIIFSPDCSGC